MPAAKKRDGIIETIMIDNPKFVVDTGTSATYDYYTEAENPKLLKSSPTGWLRYRTKKDGTEGVYGRTGAAGTETDGFVFPGPTGSPTLTAQVYGED